MLGVALWAQTPAAAPKQAAKPAAAPAKSSTAKPASATKSVPAKPAAPAAKPAPAEDPVVFTVGSESMTRSQFEQFLANLPDQVRAQTASPAGKRQLAERLAEVKYLAQEARKRQLDKKPSVQQQIQLQTEGVLAGLLVQDIRENGVSPEEELRKYYDEHKGEYEQAKARHILIRFKGSRVPLKQGQKDLTEEESLAKANELRNRIVNGEDFAALAKAESDDTNSGAQGGDLGSFARGRMVAAFETAAFAQPVGVVGEPVKSPFGYHIIQVQERGPRPFEQVRAELQNKQKDTIVAKAMAEIKGGAKVVVDETYFGPPGPPPAPPAPRTLPGTPK